MSGLEGRLRQGGEGFVTLNRAVALAQVEGPTAGLTLLETAAADPRLADHHRVHAVRAHFRLPRWRRPPHKATNQLEKGRSGLRMWLCAEKSVVNAGERAPRGEHGLSEYPQKPQRQKASDGRTIMEVSEITEILNRPISQELLAQDLTRLAYIARDGTPRSIPIGFTWNGSEIVMCTAKNAAKVRALRDNPTVALTIDTEVHPPKILLIRGRAELDVVDGIPEEFLQTNGIYTMTPEQREEWEAEVRSLYDGMVRIVVTPTWAKLIDFETTLPSAVEELVRQREERQRA